MGVAPCLDPSATAGFVIDEAEVTFWGVCAGCQDPTTTAEPTVPADHKGD